MDQLPPGIRQEYATAVERTGETEQLQRAAQRIEWLLYIGPENVEAFMRQEYQRSL